MSVYIAIYSRFYLSTSYELDDMYLYYPFLPKAVVFAVLIIFVCFFLDLYSGDKKIGRKELILKILISGFIAALGLAAFYYFADAVFLGRGILLYSLSISFIFQLVFHLGYDYFQELPIASKRVLILGTGPIAMTMGKIIHGTM